MNVLNALSPPRGTLQRLGGIAGSEGVKKSASRLLMSWGILFIGLFLLSPVSAKANGLSFQDPNYKDGIPKEIRIYCELVGSEFNICPELLEAMAYNESRFIPEVTNGKHYGLMQINVKVHADRIAKYGWTADDMLDAYKNLIIAGDYLAELYELYGDDNPIVLDAYNGNWKAIARYKEYGFLSPYAEKILTRSADYERLHGK